MGEPQAKKNDEQDQEVFETALLAGHLLLKYGAETYQIESNLEKMMMTSPNASASVNCLLTGLWISYSPEPGKNITAMTRVRGHQFNIYILIGVDRICKALIKGKMSFKEGHVRLQALEDDPEARLDPYLSILATVISGFAFALMMGGNLKECLYSAIASIGLGLVQVLLNPLPLSTFMPTFLSAFAASLILTLFSRHDPGLNLTLMMAGTLLILFPGSTLTNGIRDTMRGNFLTSAGDFFSALMTAIALASGAGISLVLTGLNLSSPSMATINSLGKMLAASIGAGLGTIAISYYLGFKGKLLRINFFIGFASWLLYLLLKFYDLFYFGQVLLAAALVGLIAWLASRHWNISVTAFTLPSLYPLVPGTQLYLAVNALLEGDYYVCGLKAGESFLVACAIAIGLLLVETIFALQEYFETQKEESHRMGRYDHGIGRGE